MKQEIWTYKLQTSIFGWTASIEKGTTYKKERELRTTEEGSMCCCAASAMQGCGKKLNT
jgi:hypothetical protein